MSTCVTSSCPSATTRGISFRRLFLGEPAGRHVPGSRSTSSRPARRHWPYHYELSEEEWLFVIEGELVVRTPDGNSTLQTGDIVCFPVGPEGAHQMWNDSAAPARFAMASAGTEGRAYVAVRPDSNTVVHRGAGVLPDRAARRSRWNTGSASREPLRHRAEDGRGRPRRLPHLVSAARAGARRSADRVQRLRDAPGQSVCPYHYEHGEEEWIVVLTGRPTVRTPEGERELRAVGLRVLSGGRGRRAQGDESRRRAGADHHLVEPLDARTTVYPDSNKVGAWPPGKAVPARRRGRVLRGRGLARNRSRRAARWTSRARVGALAVPGEVDARRAHRRCRHSY